MESRCVLHHLVAYFLFLTNILRHRGWGLRCLDDIPRGTFICTYSGQILNEEMADKVFYFLLLSSLHSNQLPPYFPFQHCSCFFLIITIKC